MEKVQSEKNIFISIDICMGRVWGGCSKPGKKIFFFFFWLVTSSAFRAFFFIIRWLFVDILATNFFQVV